MTIEMESGREFVWPDVPEDLEKWDKKTHDEGRKERRAREKERTDQGTELGLVGEEEKKSLREMAGELLGGRRRWTPGIMTEIARGRDDGRPGAQW